MRMVLGKVRAPVVGADFGERRNNEGGEEHEDEDADDDFEKGEAGWGLRCHKRKASGR